MSSSGSVGTYQTCLADLTAEGGGQSPSADALLRCVSDSFDASSANADASVDTFFLIYAASLVFFMQTGFAMLSAGCVRITNVQNTLLKNLLDACGASLGFYTVGYAFSFGGSPGATSFIGTSKFFLTDVQDDAFWLFQFAFCATSATIVAGTLAERCQMSAYLAYSIMLSAFVYPVVVHAIWSSSGFLSPTNPNPLWGSGMVDFAGGCVVHITGGVTAIVATKILGPRTGRFHDVHGKVLDVPNDYPGHSLALQCLGTFILWFGWYGFNAGSIISISAEGNYKIASHTAINTTLSGAAGCVMALFLSTVVAEHFTGEITFNLQYAMNGCLSGLVAITAGCSVVDSWASILIGLVAGGLYLGSSKLLVRRKIDDAVDAIPVHMVNGLWGTLCVGLFSEPSLVKAVYGTPHAGLFYSWGRGEFDATLLGCQVVGMLFVIAWVTFTMAPFFWMLHYVGYLRADSLEEVVGLDIGYKGGHRGGLDDLSQGKMDEYLQEYEHRRRERSMIKKVNGTLPASSVHQEGLHGNSYHGRRIITQNMIESLDAGNDGSASLGGNGGGGGDRAPSQDLGADNNAISV